jgi:hydroxymethylbilane synthase
VAGRAASSVANAGGGGVTPTALILAAHGSRGDASVLAQVRALAERLAVCGEFVKVSAAFHHGSPLFTDALSATIAPRVVVVPVMAAAGWYTEVVLPRELQRSPRFAAADVRIAPPLGVHPALPSLVEARAKELLAQFELDPARTTLIVVGHGTPKHDRSSASTYAVVDHLRRSSVCGAVLAAFLDEAPGVVETAAMAGDGDLLVIPFLISNGPHAVRDIPAALGASAVESPPFCTQIGGRRVAFDAAIGVHPRIDDIVLDLAITTAMKSGSRRGAERFEPVFASPEISSEAHTCRRGPAIQTSDGKTAPHLDVWTFGRLDVSPLRLGTRASAMAMWQAGLVARLLRAGGATIEVVELSTPGDRDRTRAIADLPGDAPFADDIEAALLGGEIDLAVHCLKDLPAASTPGLTLAAYLPRQDAREALVSRDGRRLDALAKGAVVGTSSPRRAAQVLRLRPDLRVATIRGPVEDRVAQVDAGRFDAAILAVAGLERLGLAHRASEVFSLEALLPAPGQAILVVQVRADDAAAAAIAAGLDDDATRRAAEAEWALQRAFENDRSIALGAMATCEHGGEIRLVGRIVTLDGAMVWEAAAEAASPDEAASIVTAALRGARRSSAIGAA